MERALKRSWTLPFLSAALCWLLAPPLRLDWLIWVVFVPLFVWLLQDHVPVRRAVLGAGLVGVSYYLAISRPLLSLSWWGWGGVTDAQLTVLVWRQKCLILLIIAILSAWGGVFWALCGWLTARYAKSPLRAVWFIPSLWVFAVEFLAHQTLFGMGWGVLGIHLHGAPTLRQLASLTGVAGLSFLILLVNAALSLWASGSSRSRPALVTVGLVMAACLAYGAAMLRTSASAAWRSSTLQVAVLQGNVTKSYAVDFSPEGLDQTYAALLRDALASGADLAVLPETVWLRTLQLDESHSPWDSPIRLVAADVMGRTFTELLGGRSSLIIHGIDAVLGGQVYNTMAYWTTEGLLGTYFKQHLVPFAEFTPRGLSWLPPQNQLHGSGFAYAAGREPSLVVFRGIPIGSAICQEILFAEPLRRSVRAGAQLLVTTGNDGVFLDPAVAQTMHAMAVLRAVEHQRFLVRSMKTGISSVIDPTGQVIALAPHRVRMAITAAVSPRSALSLYDQLGNWLVWLCGFLVTLIVLARPRATRSPARP